MSKSVVNQNSTWRAKTLDYLSLERNVSLASAAVFILGLGEELWKKFNPRYFEAFGASAPIVGLYGTAEDFLDAVYQYPGGSLADRLGRRKAFLTFVAIASGGYIVYLLTRFIVAGVIGMIGTLIFAVKAEEKYAVKGIGDCGEVGHAKKH